MEIEGHATGRRNATFGRGLSDGHSSLAMRNARGFVAGAVGVRRRSEDFIGLASTVQVWRREGNIEHASARRRLFGGFYCFYVYGVDLLM